MFAHISAPSVLFSVRTISVHVIYGLISMFSRWAPHTSAALAFCYVFNTGSMGRFFVDCSGYLFWFHVIKQSENDFLASQSEEVTSSSQFLVVDISALYSSCWLVGFNRVSHFGQFRLVVLCASYKYMLPFTMFAYTFAKLLESIFRWLYRIPYVSQ